MINWQPIDTAPKDGRLMLLYSNEYGDRFQIGSFRFDDNDRDGTEWGPMWLDDSYDDFSYSLASHPISPTHWAVLVAPTPVGAHD